MALFPKMLAQFKRILTDTGCCCCCCGGGKTPVTAIFTIESIKHFSLIQTLVWRKFIGLGWRYRPSYENIIVLSKAPDNYNFYDDSKKCSNVIEGINQDIPEYKADQGGEDEHPTQKPVRLMQRLILTHSLKEHIVFDLFMGGGTTAVAAEILGRRWLGCELKPEYVSMGMRKVEAERSQLKLF
jgi:site-specific DNA-methyltransferase (adenine-specific)